MMADMLCFVFAVVLPRYAQTMRTESSLCLLVRLLYNICQAYVDVLAAHGLFAVYGDTVCPGLEGLQGFGVKLDLDVIARVILYSLDT